MTYLPRQIENDYINTEIDKMKLTLAMKYCLLV